MPGGNVLDRLFHQGADLPWRRAVRNHTIDYNNVLPNISARYYIRNNWSAYAQFAEGSIIPPSNVFDFPGGNVLTPPKPTLAKTYQTGTVLKFRRWTLDTDYYYIHFQNGYASYIDPASLEPVFLATGPSHTQGIEAESNVILGGGFNLYANFSAGVAKYNSGAGITNGGKWVANAPNNVEGISLMWRHKSLDLGLIDKRVGRTFNDNGAINEAIKIDPFNIVNFFANYTIKNNSFLRGSKLGLAVNNLADNHALIGVTPALAGTLAAPFVANSGDLLNLVPGRSVMVTLTVGWAPRR